MESRISAQRNNSYKPVRPKDQARDPEILNLRRTRLAKGPKMVRIKMIRKKTKMMEDDK